MVVLLSRSFQYHTHVIVKHLFDLLYAKDFILFNRFHIMEHIKWNFYKTGKIYWMKETAMNGFSFGCVSIYHLIKINILLYTFLWFVIFLFFSRTVDYSNYI